MRTEHKLITQKITLKIEGEPRRVESFVRHAKSKGFVRKGEIEDFSLRSFIPRDVPEIEWEKWLLENWGAWDDVRAEYFEKTKTYELSYDGDLPMVGLLVVSTYFQDINFVLKRIKSNQTDEEAKVLATIVFQNGQIKSDIRGMVESGIWVDGFCYR
jgi:hypothetical protein